MAVSNDVLVTALQELLPGYTESWTLFHPAFDALVTKGNKRRVDHPFIEFVVLPEGPGSITSIINGDEHINGGRRQSSVKGSAYAATMVYAFDVPGEDLRMANGPADVAELIKKYPEAGLMDFQERIARQLVMGDGAQVGQFFTLNGDTTYNPKATGAQQGMLEFRAPSAQTGTTRFGIVSNSITNWHNQYAHTTSMGADGLKKMRAAYWDASQQGAGAEGPVDIMLADRDSYDNIVDELTDFVQFVRRDADVKAGDPVPHRLREGIAMHGAVLYPEPQMDRSLFGTAEAQQGVIYGLHSDCLKMFTQGSGPKTTGGDFEMRDVGRLPYQELFRTEFVLSAGVYCTDLRRNFTVTGCANP